MIQTINEEKKEELFTVKMQCILHPMDDYSKCRYSDEEQGIPIPSSGEMAYETGVSYTIASPLSPYVIGYEKWNLICNMINKGEWLCKKFDAVVDFENKTVTVFKKESN